MIFYSNRIRLTYKMNPVASKSNDLLAFFVGQGGGDIRISQNFEIQKACSIFEILHVTSLCAL